jgi:hypothetical protein
MHVPEILEVKELLTAMQSKSLIAAWELPFENLLTRRSAAIFFVSPSPENAGGLDEVWMELAKYEHFSVGINEKSKLSTLKYRITFNKEAKEKNNLTAR